MINEKNEGIMKLDNDLVIEFALLWQGKRFFAMATLGEEDLNHDKLMDFIMGIGGAIKVTCVKNNIIPTLLSSERMVDIELLKNKGRI